MISWRGQSLTTLIVPLIWIMNSLASSSANLPIVVTSTITTSGNVCPGVTLLFTCTTRGSAIISWTGNDYIGDQIGFNTADMVGETRRGTADSNTIATLIDNAFDGTPVLISQLQIIVSTTSSNQSVTCIHNSDGIQEPRFIFPVIVDPSRPRVTAHLTGDSMRGCTLHISWIVPENTAISNIAHFMIFIDRVNVHNETNPKNATFLSLSYLIRTCSPHNVSVSIVNRCGQVGPASHPISTANPEPIICDNTVCKENTVTASNTLTAVFASLFGICVSVVCGSIALSVALVILLFKKRGHQIKQEGQGKA